MCSVVSQAARYSRRLAAISPEVASTYRLARHASSAAPFQFFRTSMPKEASDALVDGLSKDLVRQSNGNLLDLKSGEVLQPKIDDIELRESDKYAQIAVFSKDDVNVRYGKVGVAASAKTTPDDLLTDGATIPAGVSVVNVGKHVPFKLVVPDPDRAVALASCSMARVPTHEENIAGYSVTNVIELPSNICLILSRRLESAIVEDRKNEYFFDEITAKSYSPTMENRSSGTLMSFGLTGEKTTKSHYHPGERSLYIFTTGKPCGAVLNFCGVSENPDDRKDCEVNLEFKKNSLVVLNFPPYTHHKFYGDFVCMSIHPREGVNFIEAVESGSLPKGFLESATVFSKTREESKRWRMSVPDSSTSRPRTA